MAEGLTTTPGKLAPRDVTGGHTVSSQLSIIEEHKAEAGSLAFIIN